LLNEGSSPDADAARIVERRKRRIMVDEGVEQQPMVNKS